MRNSPHMNADPNESSHLALPGSLGLIQPYYSARTVTVISVPAPDWLFKENLPPMDFTRS
jgi:hypothetical protein